MADHWPRCGGRIVLDAVQGVARAFVCEPARGVRLDLAGALGDGLRFDRGSPMRARLVRPDRAACTLAGKIGWPFVALTSFVTYAIAHNIGASVLSGAVIRYRAYSTRGLGMGEVGLLVAFCSFTFGLGAVTLGGLLLLFRPDLVERFEGAPDWVGQAAGVVLDRRACLYMLGSLLQFPVVPARQFRARPIRARPSPLRQLLAGPLELIGAAGIIFFALPGRQSRASSSCSAFSSPRSAWRWSAMRPAASACSKSRF